ncbi:glycogen synthase [Ferruginibacter sp. HRS2-29]|uniref:glycogen synthase n=1 Tax=Ferruginibacter sp. HRS2-29 TaxID=2487334 RepID=UPI0020CDC16C|nr:glycogen synthase [Ferruginibacter sp. HRS2-29]MCP9752220.1 glycogen synthase [Ferruginibacter sp. HRS2-29]
MEILHVSAECYPMAKAGGLADVVGALPKYQNKLGHVAKVVMPMHRTRFLYDNEWETVHKGSFSMGQFFYEFTVIKEKTNKLDFDLYCIDINGLLDREKIYGYDDDTERFTAFQIAVLEWLSRWEHRPDVVNVHDHHTALIPFMLRFCYNYHHLSNIPVTLTIHNAQYQGWMGWDKGVYLPAWDSWRWGLLEWDNTINPLACGIKCADKVNTVSPGYMEELMQEANGLEALFNYERGKCSGILNGIDYSVWNPKTDTYILDNFTEKDYEAGKLLNKKQLCKEFGFDFKLPLFIFIGRLVGEKAADLLPEAIIRAYAEHRDKFSFLILGSGDPSVEHELMLLNNRWIGYYNSRMEYNEKLSHQMYAGADFLLMPSRVEPCGLNQMYAMRYGTVPVVRRTGGLADTVKDYGEQNGYGICFNNASVEDILHSMRRALELYSETKKLNEVRLTMMQIKNSWEVSAQKYIDLYSSIQ